MKRISPLVKGAITGAAMLAVTYVLFSSKSPVNPNLIFIVFGLYAVGIAWTLTDHSRSPAYTGKFGDLFNKGFRCFIIVTLIMVTFTGVYSYMHPEFAEEAAKYYREDLIKKGDKTPAEIDEIVAQAKASYTTSVVSLSIFRYLVMGAVFTAAGSGILLLRRRK